MYSNELIDIYKDILETNLKNVVSDIIIFSIIKNEIY